MSWEIVSEPDYPDYEIWTCDTCGYRVCFTDVGGDVSDCPSCIARECEEERRGDGDE